MAKRVKRRKPTLNAKLPPKTLTFEKNESYQFSRGFARKVDRRQAQERFGLTVKDSDLSPGKTGINVVWLSPDGKRILSDHEAKLNNARRRSSLNIADSWNDLKTVDLVKAKNLGWNGFQRLMRATKGSKVEALKRFNTIGLDLESTAQLAVAADGETGENNGWGDSH